jgi:hypothetical protein
MGVTTGKLTADEQQVITITVPASLTRDQADELAAALNAVIAAFNAAHSGGAPAVTVGVS